MRFLNILTINKLQNEFESRPSRHFEEEPSRKLDGFFLTKLEQRLNSGSTPKRVDFKGQHQREWILMKDAA